MTYFYFVCTNPLEANLLESCGVKNILISYAFIPRFKKVWDGLLDRFDQIVVDSGAFTQFKKGKEVDIDEYTKWLRDNKEHYTHAAQLDVIGNTSKTVENYRYQVSKGVDWVWPILAGNWTEAMAKMKPHLVTNYLGIGSDTYFKKSEKDPWTIIRNLPKEYKYHGFAKGGEIPFKKQWLYSIDSSTWSFGARGREAVAWVKGRNYGVAFGKKGKEWRNDIRYMHSVLRKHFESCEIDVENVIAGEYETLLKITVAIYYKPLFEQISNEMYEKNFKF